MIEITSRFGRNAELEGEDFDEAFETAMADVAKILAAIHLVGSREAIEAADSLNEVLLTLIPPMPSHRTQNMPPLATDVLKRVGSSLEAFEQVARRDLGNPPTSP